MCEMKYYVLRISYYVYAIRSMITNHADNFFIPFS